MAEKTNKKTKTKQNRGFLFLCLVGFFLIFFLWGGGGGGDPQIYITQDGEGRGREDRGVGGGGGDYIQYVLKYSHHLYQNNGRVPGCAETKDFCTQTRVPESYTFSCGHTPLQCVHMCETDRQTDRQTDRDSQRHTDRKRECVCVS